MRTVVLTDRAPSEHGWFYHFMDMRTGARAWKSELSSNTRRPGLIFEGGARRDLRTSIGLKIP